jgi:hypothetical protein
VVSPTANTSYTVAGTSTAGCASASPAASNVTVNPLPIISANTSNTLICAGESAVLMASGASNYTFNPGGTGTSIVVSPTVNSSYTITGSDANGCLNSGIFTQRVSVCEGIAQWRVESPGFEVFPNPTNGIITVQSAFAIQDVAEMYNSLGQLLYVAEMKDGKLQIDLSREAKGIYFLKLGTEIKRIIKE